MAMAVKQQRAVERLELHAEAAGPHLAADELLEQQGLRCDHLCLGAEMQRQRLVAQRQQARGLESDDGNVGLRQRQHGFEQAREQDTRRPMIAKRWNNCAATSRAWPRTEERVQTNATGQAVLKLKTPWRDGTTHLVLRLAQTVQWTVCASRRARALRGRGLQGCQRWSACSGWLRWLLKGHPLGALAQTEAATDSLS